MGIRSSKLSGVIFFTRQEVPSCAEKNIHFRHYLDVRALFPEGVADSVDVLSPPDKRRRNVVYAVYQSEVLEVINVLKSVRQTDKVP